MERDDSVVFEPLEISYNIEKLTTRYELTSDQQAALTNTSVELIREKLDEVLARMYIEMATHIPYRDGESIEVPATWWDHFKDRWFPEWAKDRWPVETERLCPRAYAPSLLHTKANHYHYWIASI